MAQANAIPNRPPANPPANQYTLTRADWKVIAAARCIHIFEKFEENELDVYPSEIRLAWEAGRELRAAKN